MTEIKRKIYLAEGDAPNGYQSTPIGFLPSDWEYAKLSDLSLELTETAGEKKYETVSISAGIGFVNQAKKFGKELSGKQYEKYIVLRKGDFSYNKGNSNRYPQGCIYRLNDREEAAVPNVFESFRIVKGCPEYYEQLFISGFLNHQLFRLINHGVRDDGLLNLTGTDFYSCLLPVPPVKEQERIADLLSTCDSMISRYEEIAEQYRTLKKHLLNNMFPKGGSAVPEIRFPGFTDAWEQCKFKDAVEISTEMVDPKTGLYDGLIHIGPGDMEPHTGQLIPDVKTVAESELISGKFHFYQGDVVYSKIRPELSKCVIAPTEGLASADAYVLRGKGDICQSFLYTLLQTEHFYNYSTSVSMRTGMPKINRDELGSYVFYAPSIQEQQKNGSALISIDNLITLHQREAEMWKTKKKALSQLLLTGIVRV